MQRAIKPQASSSKVGNVDVYAGTIFAKKWEWVNLNDSWTLDRSRFKGRGGFHDGREQSHDGTSSN